jgi:hypothetical protein
MSFSNSPNPSMKRNIAVTTKWNRYTKFAVPVAKSRLNGKNDV